MASLGNITFACEDPRALTKFWAGALEYDLEEPPPGIIEAIEAEGGDLKAAAAAVDPTEDGPRLFFKKMARSSPDHIPIHLDLNADNREAEVERLTELGTTVVETKTGTTGPVTETWTSCMIPKRMGSVSSILTNGSCTDVSSDQCEGEGAHIEASGAHETPCFRCRGSSSSLAPTLESRHLVQHLSGWAADCCTR